jgi:hypothetical protein
MASMSEPCLPLSIELDCEGTEAFAGTWFPITVRLKCPASQPHCCRIRNIDCTDKEIQLDSDLLQRDVELRRGESYRFTIYLNVPHVGVIKLSSIYVEVAGEVSDIFHFPDQELQIRPALGRDISIKEEPICSYGNVTKLQLTFHHQGGAPYENLRISFGPESAVHAGKQQIHREVFRPNDEEVVMVATSEDLELTLTATTNDRASLRFQKKIPFRTIERKNGELFRFLELDKLSSDQILIRNKNRKGEPIALKRSAYPLVGGGNYQVVIRPQQAGVIDIQLKDVPGSIYVRAGAFDPEESVWKFDIDVAFSELLTKSERLIYRVTSKDGPLTGEIYVSLAPPGMNRWKFAIAVGIAATAQGVAALARALLNPEMNLEEVISGMKNNGNYSPLLVLSIPLVWVATMLYDRLQYRLRN